MRRDVLFSALAICLVFSWSCAIYSWRKTPLRDVEPEKRAEVQISAVQVRSGEKTELGKSPPARIQGDSIVGDRFFKNFVLERSKIKSPEQFYTGAPAEITTVDGVRYTAKRLLSQTASSVTFDGSIVVSIPLVDADLVWIRKINVPATILLYIGPLVAFEIIEAIVWSSEQNK